jgi:hypothetical protein
MNTCNCTFALSGLILLIYHIKDNRLEVDHLMTEICREMNSQSFGMEHSFNFTAPAQFLYCT